MAAATNPWRTTALGQYVGEEKLVKVLLDKAKAKGLTLCEDDFEIQVSVDL